MQWSYELEQAYSEMFDGAMWQALDLPEMAIEPALSKQMIQGYISKLENDEYEELKIIPENQNYLTLTETRTLHWMRVACCFYAERVGIFPWRLRDKSADKLRPLLSFHYQGISRCTDVRYGFESVWDVNPGKRLKEAIDGYVLLAVLALFGSIKVPVTEYDMIIFLIDSLRKSGWKHVEHKGEPFDEYDVYAEYQSYDPWADNPGTYDFEAISEVRESTCHIASNYLVALLRSFNIPAHRGYSANPDFMNKPLWDMEWADQWHEIVHRNGHCFIHFSSIDKWFSHGDDLYDLVLKGIPTEHSFQSDEWMNDFHIDTTEYDHHRATRYAEYSLWCLYLGRSNKTWYDVRYLYNRGWLRERLENIHEALEGDEGAPPTIPPVFSENEVDFLMDWVAYKIEKEQENQ